MIKENSQKLLALATFLAALPRAHAVNYTWTGATDNNWSTPSNWSTGAVPSAISHPYIIANNQSLSVNLDADYFPGATLSQLDLSAVSAASLTFNQTGRSIYMTPPPGQVAITISSSSNSQLVYNLSGGVLYGSSSFIVISGQCAFNLSNSGYVGSYFETLQTGATFSQTGGTNNCNNITMNGATPAFYSLSAGSLSGTNVIIGPGLFTQTGGNQSLTGALALSSQPGGAGTYILQNGSLSTGSIGASGGTFTQTGGAFTTSTLTQTGGTVTLGGPQALYSIPTVSLFGGTFAFTSDTVKTLVTNSITFNKRFDLATGNIILRAPQTVTTAYTTLRTALKAGSVFSSALTPATSLAVVSGSDYLTLHGGAGATFAGQSIGPNDAILAYALLGDADLSGTLTTADYAQLNAGFFFGNFDGTSHIASWSNGDFNNDGKITYQDYALLDAAFANQGNLAADFISEHTTQFGTPYLTALSALSIPEPTTAAFLLLATPLLLRRRKI